MQYDKARLFAEYWIAMATTGVVHNKSLEKSAQGKWMEFTDLEKREHALKISRNHMNRMEDLAESKIELMKEIEELS